MCWKRDKRTMKIICSPNRIVDEKRPKNGMIDIKKAGFVQLLLDTNIGKDGILASQMKDAATTIGLACSVGTISIEDKMQPVHTECETLIVLPLSSDGTKSPEELWMENETYYMRRLQELQDMKGDHIMPQILLQNSTREVNGHMVRGICAEAEHACQWIDDLNASAGEEAFGMCVDIGALNLCGQDPYEYICTLGKRVKAVRLRENDGHNDCAMLPFTSVSHGISQVDWLGMIRGLRRIDFDGIVIMDFGDTASAFSPLLRSQVISMAKSIAEYFKWQIEIESLLKKYPSRVLFGAGNMCRNYMNTYGEQYPPLFTCDNNKEIWGRRCCGLEIKPPENLKALPSDCAIFICNIYYREIEQQLREMGITNAIEYFNDEYLPAFYME